MQIDLLPLLRTQRDLLTEPRNFGRFQTYLKTMVDGDDLRLPLSAFNPMSKGHVATLLDRLIEMDAEAIAQESIGESVTRLSAMPEFQAMRDYRVGLVVVDDAEGGWTNRFLTDAKERFENAYNVEHGFITALIWSSETPDAERIRVETASAIFRTAWIWKHGLPRTLGQMLLQEGRASQFAGVAAANAPDHAIELARRYWDTRDYPTIITCLYGDETAATLGYPPVGMSADGALLHAADARIMEGGFTP